MNRLVSAFLLGSLLAGCVSVPQVATKAPAEQAPAAAQVVPFSVHPPGEPPPGWDPLIILRDRKATEYRLVEEEGRIVLRAFAKDSSSALMHAMTARPAGWPWLHWQWKVRATSMTGAGPAERGSPVRIVLGFDGDKESLPFTEQILFDTAKLITGHDFPYATLMYVWAEDLPVGTVVRSRHSSRIRMVVADNGASGIGGWRRFSRNVAEDFERAFGEKPGQLLGVGVLTDDAEGEDPTEAWYGDISLSDQAGVDRASRMAAVQER